MFGPPFNNWDSSHAFQKVMKSIYEAREFVCFVCTDEIHRTGMLQIMLLVSLESSQAGGLYQLGFMAFGFAVYKFLNIE
jgi:hypothetical protein